MAITLSEDTLQLLVCPISGQPLRFASTEETKLAFPNDESVHSGLITKDGTRIYPVRDEMPVLIPDDSVEIAPVES